MVQIFAHRGFSGYYPENTMLAFQKVAEETVADGIELDIQLTKDGEIVIMHDEMLDRTTNGSGWLKDHTLEELKMLSVGVNVKGFFPRQTIPTLREYFTWLKTTKLITNIELKTSYFEYEGIEEKLIAMVKEFGLEDQIWYSSFNHYSIQQMKKIVPEAETAYLYSDVILNVAEYAKNTKVDGLHPAVYHVKMADFLKEYLGSNLNVRVWTVNEKADMKWLIDAGVTAIITNYPDMAVQIKKEAEV